MRIDPSKMKPAELARLLNSTKLGAVTTANRLYREFDRLGYGVASDADTSCINFARYAAALADRRAAPQPKAAAKSYEERKEEARARNAAQSQSGRDIGELPPVADPERREACRLDFRLYCETYFPEVFDLEWSPDHLKAIAKIEQAVLKGGLFALAMSRGSGKSSLTEAACLWAMVYGHRDFVVLIGATEAASTEMMDSIKTELEVNEHLAADFPEVCFPIAALDGISNRCAGQLHHGKRTRITWTANEIVLPTIDGAPSSGTVVRVAGITGRVRGMKYKHPSGRTLRPSLVIIDDPQTSESAGSAEQTRKRVRVLEGDILGLAGPGRKISGIMPCTVIRPGDMAEQILDRKKHPEWNGEKSKLVYSFPKNTALWEKYADLRADGLREDGNFSRATEFYRANREAMDEGAEVGWKARYNYDEESAVQHAMNLKFQDEAAFWAEYQNEPLPEDLGGEEQLTADSVLAKLAGRRQYAVPLACSHLTCFIDVQQKLLFYTVCAFSDDFTGAVIDYGAWPGQRRRAFSLSDANPTIRTKFPKAGFEGALYGALGALTKDVLSREYPREDGAAMRIERCLVDANWGDSTEVVYQFCRESPFSNILLPSHGRYVGASSKPMSEYKKTAGEVIGNNWRMPNVNGKRASRHVIYDTNFWKSFMQQRIETAMGDRGSFTLWGRDPARHELYAEHLAAEYKVRTEGRGRRVDEWRLKPSSHDNHWLDCTVGCMVAASMCGCALKEAAGPAPDAKAKIRLSDIRRKRLEAKRNGGR